MIGWMLHHVALRSEWETARGMGRYEMSTLGRSLAEVGFVHACHPRQVEGVLERFYADVDESLVLLVIHPALLGCEVREEPAPGTEERFPHIYGPIPVDAVVEVRPIEAGA